MADFGVRLIEHVHGHLGLLSAAALAHPAIVLRRATRRAHLAVGLATALPVCTGAIGAWLYMPYREQLKQGIFIDSRTIGNLFERKEHLAFGAVAFALAGACAYVASRTKGGDEKLGRAAHVAFVVSFSLSVVTAVLGIAVASYRTF